MLFIYLQNVIAKLIFKLVFNFTAYFKYSSSNLFEFIRWEFSQIFFRSGFKGSLFSKLIFKVSFGTFCDSKFNLLICVKLGQIVVKVGWRFWTGLSWLVWLIWPTLVRVSFLIWPLLGTISFVCLNLVRRILRLIVFKIPFLSLTSSLPSLVTILLLLVRMNSVLHLMNVFYF